jgi:RNA polymerase sigma factor (sigma-70 family)
VKTVHEQEERPRLGPDADAARKRAAVETYARNEAALRRTARRYSLCEDDADDALQRGLEILLRKAPTDDPRELIKWTQTVVKHEALAVRKERERILAGPAAVKPEPETPDWVSLIPASSDGPPERAERREAIARSREALQTLKPQELRALTLLAEGYSYAEIGEITDWSRTKINRCLAEGRERFRDFLARSDDGSRCAEVRPLISAFCDGEASEKDAAELREHLRACGNCRATLRTYRKLPAAAAALAPALPLHRALLGRAQEAFGGITARLSGAAAGNAGASAAAGSGAGGLGAAAVAKIAAVCVGAAAGAAACIATGVLPPPPGLASDPVPPPRIERRQPPPAPLAGPAPVEYEPQPGPTPTPGPAPAHQPRQQLSEEAVPAAPAASAVAATEGSPVEYAPPPAPEPVEAAPSGGSAGSPAGEFGP